MSNRDARGRFTRGHTIRGNSPGRPPRSIEETALEDWHEVIDRKSRCEVIKKLLDMALAGDFRCIKLIITYELGTPIQRIEAQVDTSSEIDVRYQRALERVKDVDDETV